MLRARWLRLRRGDRLAVIVLVAVPAIVSFGPTIAGRPLLNGDNFYQNYPLRVLVGQVIRHGHLPWWDPLIFNGTPLMAGWNAGAGFPGSWLFAVLPGPWAWAINLFAAGLCAALGTFALARRHGLGPAGSFVAAGTYTFTGFLLGQSAHFGLIMGMSLLPILLIGIDLVGERPSKAPLARSIPAVMLLGSVAGLVVLTGEPRAISNVAIVAAIYVLAWCWRSPSRVPQLVALVAIAAALGAALSASQWLPGLEFLRASERGQGSYALYAVGSLRWSWGVLALLPYVLGGNANFGQVFYNGPLNLPELSYGVGLLPLVAAIVLLPRALRRRGRRLPAEPPSEDSSGSDRTNGSRLGVWYAVGLVGLVLALGVSTPLGHVLWHLPLFGSQRLQNRNIGLTDFALAMLGGHFVDSLARRPSRHERSTSSGLHEASRVDNLAGLAGLVIPLAALGVIGVVAADPLGFQQAMGVGYPVADLAGKVLPTLVCTSILAVAIGLLVIVRRRARPALVSKAAVAIAILEIAFLAANGPYALAPRGSIAFRNPDVTQLARFTGPQGRYAFFDPYFYVAPSTLPVAQQLGFFDLGIVHSIASVQGYGSVLSQSYQQATFTHEANNLNLAVISSPTADALDLTALVTAPQYLDQSLQGDEAVPIATRRGPEFDRSAGEVVLAGEPAARSGPWGIPPGATHTWFLPSPRPGATATIFFDPTVASRPSEVTVGFSDSTGHVVTKHVAVTGSEAITTAPPGLAVAEVSVSLGPLSKAAVVAGVVAASSGGTNRILLDGLLQVAMGPLHWRLAGDISGLPVFENRRARGPSFLLASRAGGLGGPRLPGSSAVTPSVPVGANERTDVDATRPAVLVRSSAYSPGWYAEISRSGGGPTIVRPVVAFGAVQSVAVPAGRSVVTWVYRTRSIRLALDATLAGLLGLVGLGAIAVVQRRRRAPDL